MSSTHVIVQGQYEFIHRYDGAPEAVKYLRSPHRHMFFYRVEIEVFHDDRELEFILLKHDIETFLGYRDSIWDEKSSCEQMARSIGEQLLKNYGPRALSVTVMEDDENGAKVIF